MQKGFGLIGILIVVGIIAILSVGALKTDYFSRNSFVPTDEEKLAIKQAEEMKNVLEQKNNNTVTSNTVVDETKDWKTYRNDKYGFEFKYPSDWNISVSKVVKGPQIFGIDFSVPYSLYPNSETKVGVAEIILFDRSIGEMDIINELKSTVVGGIVNTSDLSDVKLKTKKIISYSGGTVKIELSRDYLFFLGSGQMLMLSSASFDTEDSVDPIPDAEVFDSIARTFRPI